MKLKPDEKLDVKLHFEGWQKRQTEQTHFLLLSLTIFFHFIRLFWYHVFTWSCVSPSDWARSNLQNHKQNKRLHIRRAESFTYFQNGFHFFPQSTRQNQSFFFSHWQEKKRNDKNLDTNCGFYLSTKYMRLEVAGNCAPECSMRPLSYSELRLWISHQSWFAGAGTLTLCTCSPGNTARNICTDIGNLITALVAGRLGRSEEKLQNASTTCVDPWLIGLLVGA